jgi:hypothetical protein
VIDEHTVSQDPSEESGANFRYDECLCRARKQSVYAPLDDIRVDVFFGHLCIEGLEELASNLRSSQRGLQLTRTDGPSFRRRG